MIPVAGSIPYAHGSYCRIGSKLYFYCPGGKFVMPAGLIPDLAKGISINRLDSGAVSGSVHVDGWAMEVNLDKEN